MSTTSTTIVAGILLLVAEVTASPAAAQADPCGPVFPMPGVPAAFGLKQATLGDIDGDGSLDVAVITRGVSLGPHLVRWYLSDGAFGFGPPTDDTGFVGVPLSVALGDVDNDGTADLVIGTDFEVRVKKNTGGAFVFADQLDLPAGFFARELVLVDHDADLDADIAFAGNDPSNGWLQLFTSTGGGSIALGQETHFTQPVSSLVAAQLDANANGDLLMFGSFGTQALLGVPGGVAAIGPPVGLAVGRGSVGDFDGDGDIDSVALVAGAFGSAGLLQVAFNDGAGAFSFGPTVNVPHDTADIAASDVDADGDPDVLVIGTWYQLGITTQDRLTLFANDGTGGLAPVQSIESDAYTWPRDVTAGDLDGDGRGDFVASFENSPPHQSYLALFHGAETGTGVDASPRYATGTTPTDVFAADLDGDNDADVVSASGTGSVRYFRNLGPANPGALAAAVTVSVSPAAARFVTAIDLDGDGDRDLVSGGNTTGQTPGVRTFLNAGNATFGAGTAYSTVGVVSGLATGDFDSNGRTDVATTHSANGLVSILLANGAGGFLAPVTTAAGNGAESITALDVDGDAKIDLVVSNRTINQVSFLRGHGDGTFDLPVAHAVPVQPQGITGGDFNGNGVSDVAVATAGSVTILFDAFSASLSVPVGQSPVDTASGDVDGDGRLELFVSNRLSGTFSVVRGVVDSTTQVEPVVSFRVGRRAEVLVSADLDGDARPDICIASQEDIVTVFDDLAAAAANTYGSAKAGTLGAPSLQPGAPPLLGAVAGFDVAGGLPGAQPLLFVGLAATNLPFDLGTLLVSPLFVVVLPSFPGSGIVPVAGMLPADPALRDLRLYFQAMFQDAGAVGPYHTAQTAGLAWTLGT